jgi:hypothetical protein
MEVGQGQNLGCRVKGKKQAVEAHTVVKRRGSHIF